MPKSNVEYWTAKIERNVKRDAETRSKLDRLGWKSRVIWECEIVSGVASLLDELCEDDCPETTRMQPLAYRDD